MSEKRGVFIVDTSFIGFAGVIRRGRLKLMNKLENYQIK